MAQQSIVEIPHGVHQVDNCNEILLDTCCRRSCAGKKWHRESRKSLATDGLKPVRRPVAAKFNFGEGREAPAKYSWEYPVGYFGNNGVLDIAELEEENCPASMSNQAMKNLKIAMDFETDTMSVKAADVFDQPMHYASSGHPALQLHKFKPGALFPGKVPDISGSWRTDDTAL